ncbi:conserved hypothetical protein [Prevotella intermedia]|uniref:Prophage tail endopeptidase domain-containing protein n=1 Tax=Prevotella intermedia TaxID=28131 RepID=A0A0T7AP70_PREIN|nr:hypothetical protein [Prevotella intermedia]BAU18861.1 conserved hypothetical protein [Prevotella intermedia]
MIEIFTKDDIVRCIADSANGRQDKQLQGDNTLSLTFTLYEYVQLDVNDYVDFCGERYWLMERFKPRMKSTKEWEYNLTLYGIESLIKRFLVINYTDNENTPIFTLTAPAEEHAKIILASINNAIGKQLFKLGEVKQTENLVIDYKGTYCNDALDLLAKAAKTEFWFESGTTLNISKAQYGEALTLGYRKGLISLSREKADNVKFYTRLFPLGSTKNIDRDKYGHTRLQLPGGQKYIDKDVDKYGVVHHFEEAAFADIYPRRIGTVSAVRSQERTGKDNKPFTIYYFKDKDLNFNPNDYKIGGYVMRVAFQEGSELAGQGTSEEHYFEVNFDDKAKEFEIITIFPNDTMQVPGGVLVPKVGDKYILSHLRMPDEYYPLAEKEFLEAVKKFNEENFIDNSVYKADTDHVWVEQQRADLFLGRRIRLESAEYFAPVGYRMSRITRLSRQVDLPSLVSIEMSDAVAKGKIAAMEGSINDVRHYIGEVANDIPDIIGSGDDTLPGEHNVFSAKRALKEFLNKNTPDTAQEIITFLKGIAFKNGAAIDGTGNAILKAIQTLGFERTINGFGVWLDEKGRAHGQIDYLEVIGKAIFRSLQIDEYKHIGGNIVLSGANAIIEKVARVPGGWKCYLHTDDGDKAVTVDWVAGDQPLCQTFNIKAGVYENVSNRYYWRVVSEVSQKTATEEAYIVITADDTYRDQSVDNDEPKAGDNIVLCGHNTLWDIAHGVEPTKYRNRMNVTMITTSKEEGGTIEVYRNIHDFSLNKGNTIFHLSSEKIYMNSRHFEWVSSDGERIPNVLYRGDWTPGTAAAKYEAWYHAGGTWLSLVDDNADEPTGHSPKWKQYAAKGEDGTSPYTVQIHSESGGNVIHNGQGEIQLVATVFHGEQDITPTLPTRCFSWVIQSGNTDFDTAWNARHAAVGNRISIRAEEVSLKAQIDCIVDIDR